MDTLPFRGGNCDQGIGLSRSKLELVPSATAISDWVCVRFNAVQPKVMLIYDDL